MYTKTYTIAVDFDGTVVEDKYPNIGRPKIFAFDTMKKLQERGHRLILWTYRHGDKLQEAVDFCKENGVEFYAVNRSFPEEEFDGSASRKLNADYFVDDRNIGGLVEWGEVYQLLTGEKKAEKSKQKGWFRR